MTYNIISTRSKAGLGTEEQWLPVRGFEGLYEVSSFGRMKSYKVEPEGQILSLKNKTGDYFRFVLQGIGKKQKSVAIHRLVAEHFIPNPDGLPEVNHIDGNKQNNAVWNLEWCSRSHNVKHSIKMHPSQLNGMIFHNKCGRTRFVVQLSRSGEVISAYFSAASASKHTGVCARNILQVANRTPFNSKGQVRKTAGGYVWRFMEEVMPNDL